MGLLHHRGSNRLNVCVAPRLHQFIRSKDPANDVARTRQLGLQQIIAGAEFEFM
jgi:hypothetical protein